MPVASASPRIPSRCCTCLQVKALVAGGVLDGGVGSSSWSVQFTDPTRPGITREEPISVVRRGDSAILSIAGQHFACESRPLKAGRRWWGFKCSCGRPCRKLWRPVDAELWACGECWRIRPPSQEPSRAGRRKVDAGNPVDYGFAENLALYHAAAAFYGGAFL